MSKTVAVAAFVAALTCLGSAGPLGLRAAVAAAAAAQADPDDVKIRALLQRLEQIARRSDAAAYLALLAGSADREGRRRISPLEFRPRRRRASSFRSAIASPSPGTLPGNGYSLTVDAFMEYGDRARVATWQLDVKRVDDDWRIAGQQTSVRGREPVSPVGEPAEAVRRAQLHGARPRISS